MNKAEERLMELKEELKSICGSRSLLLDDNTSWDGSAAEKRMRTKATGSDDKVNWSEYGKGFVYCDQNKKEELGEYKLPFADVVGGTLKAVWGGVHTAFAVLSGSRGGVSMSDQDKTRCISFLKIYYKRFNKPLPEKRMIKLFYWVRIKFKIYLGRILYYGVPSFCKECGKNITDFSIDDEIWNKIDPLIKNGHSLCYDCFCKKCKIVGLPEVWKLVKNE